MKKNITLLFILSCFLGSNVFGQTIATIKKQLEIAPNPFQYVKFTLKKKFSIDTVTVYTTESFLGVEDSIAYSGKIGKAYGPFYSNGSKYLLKVLAKLPNTFYHVSHILIDTAIFKPRFADSLATSIITKIQEGRTTFDLMARTYSSDNYSAIKGGDLGWFIRGIMLPQLDAAITNHKKGEMFTVWTSAGIHIVKVTDNPKKDNGYALLLKVIL